MFFSKLTDADIMLVAFLAFLFLSTFVSFTNSMYLDLPLPNQSMPTTTKVVTWIMAVVRCTWYNIMLPSLPVTCGRIPWFPPPNKTGRHKISEILLKVTLNTNIYDPFALKSSRYFCLVAHNACLSAMCKNIQNLKNRLFILKLWNIFSLYHIFTYFVHDHRK